MTDEELLELDAAGFIPGPGEEEGPFRKRVESAKKRFEEGEWIPGAHWDWVRQHLNGLFCVKPLYICAFYSSKGLAPWQGGASWIEGGQVHSIQLRRACWRHRPEELMAHEAVHAVRSGFDEEEYEEFFAYMSSEKKWRRALGPIVKRPWEVWPFLLLLTAAVVWPEVYIGAGLWMALGVGRLVRKHCRLHRAGKKILEVVQDPSKARGVLLRLTDEEIERLAGKGKLEYMGDGSLRWRLIAKKFGLGEKI